MKILDLETVRASQALSLWGSSRARLHIVLNSETFCSTRPGPKLKCKFPFMMIYNNNHQNCNYHCCHCYDVMSYDLSWLLVFLLESLLCFL